MKTHTTSNDHASRLIKDQYSPAVYFVIDGKKSWIPNPETYFHLIDSWDKITLVDNVSLYPDGPKIDENAQLIRRKDLDKVYLVQFGEKRWITCPKVFESLGLSWDKINKVDPYVLQLFKEGPNIV